MTAPDRATLHVGDDLARHLQRVVTATLRLVATVNPALAHLWADRIEAAGGIEVGVDLPGPHGGGAPSGPLEILVSGALLLRLDTDDGTLVARVWIDGAEHELELMDVPAAEL
jgi:hypothetical protein